MSSVPSRIYFFSLSRLLYIKIKKKKSNLSSQDHTTSIYLCSCISLSLQPKRQQKAMPEIACPWWSLPGSDKAGCCPSPTRRPHRDSAPEAVFWLDSSFLSPFPMCLSLRFGFAFSFQKAESDSSNSSGRNNPNVSSLKLLLFPEKAVAPSLTLSNRGQKGISS